MPGLTYLNHCNMNQIRVQHKAGSAFGPACEISDTFRHLPTRLMPVVARTAIKACFSILDKHCPRSKVQRPRSKTWGIGLGERPCRCRDSHRREKNIFLFMRE